MCGLFGIMSYGIENDYKQAQETAIRIIGTEMLQLLEDRGGDATGVAALFEDCNYMGLKMGIAATEFLSRFGNKKEDYEGWLDIMRKKESPTRMFIGHCRKSSVGNSTDNVNNHPLYINNRILGVHNGTLTNHDAIFHNLECERDGTVDSEAIFRLLYHFLNKGKDPFTEEAIQETCKRIHGTYAVIALNTINPNQVAVFRDGRPLAFALVKRLNILLIASEEKYIKHSIFKYNKLSTLYKLGDNFIRLTKKDVSFSTLNDDSMAIFDNRVTIDNLEVKDLIHSIKIPRNKKIWKNRIINESKTKEEKTTKKDSNGEVDKNNSSNSGNNTTKHNNWNNRYTKKTKSEETCMLWSNKFNKLDLIKDDVYVDSLLGIEIDTVANNVFEINNSKKTKLLKYSATVKENQNNSAKRPLLEDKSKKSRTLVEASDKEVLSGTTKTSVYINNKLYNNKEDNTKNPITTSENKSSIIEVDVSVNSKAVELSEITSKYKMKRYSNDDEAMEAIDIVDKSIIKAMPFYSLCNRIKRFAFKEGFYNGYVKRIKEQEEININKLKNKKNKAEKKIRVLKTLSKLLSKELFNYTEFNIFDMQANLKRALKDKQEIDSKTLKSIYSKKDLKACNAINRITTLLELTKNGEALEIRAKEKN